MPICVRHSNFASTAVLTDPCKELRKLWCVLLCQKLARSVGAPADC
jgi:hypothetical protein